MLLTGTHLETNFRKILIKTCTFSFKKMHLKMLFGKCQPFCLSRSVLKKCFWNDWLLFYRIWPRVFLWLGVWCLQGICDFSCQAASLTEVGVGIGVLFNITMRIVESGKHLYGKPIIILYLSDEIGRKWGCQRSGHAHQCKQNLYWHKTYKKRLFYIR